MILHLLHLHDTEPKLSEEEEEKKTAGVLWDGPICLLFWLRISQWQNDNISTFFVSYSDKCQSQPKNLEHIPCHFLYSTSSESAFLTLVSCRTQKSHASIYHQTIIHIYPHCNTPIDMHRFIFQRFQLTSEAWQRKSWKTHPEHIIWFLVLLLLFPTCKILAQKCVTSCLSLYQSDCKVPHRYVCCFLLLFYFWLTDCNSRKQSILGAHNVD